MNHVIVKPAGSATDASCIPVIETERLRLRAFTLNDLPAACELWADENVVRFIGAHTRSKPEVWTSMARSFGHWALLGYGFWALADKESDVYLGEIGYLEGLRDLHPPHTPDWINIPEAGWALAEHAWGHGFATEALQAVCNWSDQNLTAEHTQCLIDPDHKASLRVAANNGYKPLREAGFGADREPTVVLTRKRGA
mgnify:CR=1 FL=1